MKQKLNFFIPKPLHFTRLLKKDTDSNLNVTRYNLLETIKILKNNYSLPKNIEICNFAKNKFFLTSAYDQKSSKTISESVSCGFSNSSNLSTLKSLVEYIERKALNEGYKKGLNSCLRDRSEGTAAYPSFIKNYDELKIIGKYSSLKKARDNAYFECIERYVWSKWWNNFDIAHDSINIFVNNNKQFDEKNSLVSKYSLIIDSINSHTPIVSIKAIFPYFNGYSENYNPKLLILVAELKDGGFIPAGAVGNTLNLDDIYLRAFSELYRHSLAVKKFKTQNVLPLSKYENRLYFFSMGYGDKLVKNRLNYQGLNVLKLPELEIDEEILHELSEYFSVYRCLFKNMPQFINNEEHVFCI